MNGEKQTVEMKVPDSLTNHLLYIGLQLDKCFIFRRKKSSTCKSKTIFFDQMTVHH